METWVSEILDGMDKLPPYHGTPGTMIVYGEHSHPIVANHQGQILLAAAEYGAGRVLVFSHGSMTHAKSFTQDHENPAQNRFYTNVKRWVTKGHLSDEPVIKDFKQIGGDIGEDVEIVLVTSSTTPNTDNIKTLMKYVTGGGGLVVGLTPWGYLQLVKKYNWKTLPMNKLIKNFGIKYVKGYFSSKSKDLASENHALNSHLLHAIQGVGDVQLVKRYSAALLKTLHHIPDKVFHAHKDTIFDAYASHKENGFHMEPTNKDPVHKDEEKAMVKVLIHSFEKFGRVRELEKIPACDSFPGDFEEPPLLSCANLNLDAPGYDTKAYHSTGWYVPAGQELVVTVLEGFPDEKEDPWAVAIGAHGDTLFNVDRPWRRWPGVQVRKNLLVENVVKSTSKGQCHAGASCSDGEEDSEEEVKEEDKEEDKKQDKEEGKEEKEEDKEEEDKEEEVELEQCQTQQQSHMLANIIKLKTHTGGLVYFISEKNTKKPLSVLVENIVEAPYFDLEKEELKANWNERKSSAGLWADLVGRRIRLTIPSTSLAYIDDVEGLMNYWDSVVEAHYELGGQLEDYQKKQWVVSDEQPSAGYMHAGYPIVTGLGVVGPGSKNKKAGTIHLERLLEEGQWGLFHEIGHNTQHKFWTFAGTGEVTCNIFTLHAMDVLHGQQPWIHPWVQKFLRRAKSYLSDQPDIKVWQKSAGLALIIYAQLARDFGWDAYKQVFREYRQLSKAEQPKTNAQKIHQWIVRFSKVAEKNLCPLFAFWGFDVEEETQAALDGLPCHLVEDEITEMAPDRLKQIRKEYNMTMD